MKIDIHKTLYCSECGSKNVQIMSWVNPNTGEHFSVNNPLEEEDCWCEDCSEHTMVATLSRLWEMFSEIPIDNNDQITEPFLNFPAGTDRFEIWHWFDEECPNGVVKDLINEEE